MRLKRAQERYDNLLNQVNYDWSQKLQEEKSSTESMLREQLNIRKTMEASYEEIIKTKVDNLNEGWERKMFQLMEINKELHRENALFKYQINEFEKKLNTASSYVDKVLRAFQSFVDVCPGFCEGQGEYILQNLIPHNAEN